MSLTANSPDSSLDAKRTQRITDYVTKQIETGLAPMMSVSVIHDGKLVHQTVKGNATTSTTFESDSICRFYSMTKPLVSAAIMLLCERAELDLSDPIAKYIPAFKHMNVLKTTPTPETEEVPTQSQITIQHLLTHTSGIAYNFSQSPIARLIADSYESVDFNPEVDIASLNKKIAFADIPTEDLVQKLAKQPLVCEPGKEFNYGRSFDVLGYLIEVLTKKKLAEFLKEEFFDPLGMADSSFWVPKEKADRLTALYGINPKPDGAYSFSLIDSPVDSNFLHPHENLQSGGGGLLSTTDDYLKFMHMLLDDGKAQNGEMILSSTSIKLMMMDHLPDGVMLPELLHMKGLGGNGYGLGGSVVLDPAKNKHPASKGSYSWGGAANTYMMVDPSLKLGYLIVTQVMPSFVLCHWRREIGALVYALM
eukprot:m.34485 g.34485  ORF g.34485 m.34485 type:complete len:421 (-) comp16978_c0_seq1:113-1375(-)